METDGPPEETNPAEVLFAQFLYTDQSIRDALDQFSSLKQLLQLDQTPHHQLFSKIKGNFKSWRITSFLEILQRRLNIKEYASSVAACKDTNVFVIGAGPCGLRLAIEAALCGAYVVVVEKRDTFTRNNVLHLWPYLIHDLRNLGVKKLFGKFCAGSLDHISIKRLQLILLKISLVLGVKFFTNSSYVEYLEPLNGTGWRISVEPTNPEIECIDFDVLVGADGKRNSIPGFQRKEFRAKLAIGITANFVNRNSDEEAKIDEISGVASLFNQKFFADLKTETDIDLENIVYYKDDTHYFVMTAKKQCLLLKGVLKEDHSDVIKLLSYKNVDNSKLQYFVQQAADFSAGLPHSTLAINPDTGKEDVAIFDFTSMYSAEYASRIVERAGKRLIVGLVGDALMEPFWPLGTGCARGFLSCMDLMWMVKQHQLGVAPGKLLEDRMSHYQLLHQTTNGNMQKKHSAYTMNPKTRYTIIPKFTDDVSHLYEFDEKENKRARVDVNDTKKPAKKRLAGETTETVHKQWKKNTFARTRKPKHPSQNSVLPNKRPLSPDVTDVTDEKMLLEWCRGKLQPILPYLPVADLDSCWRDGVLLCGLVHLCAPPLVDISAVKSNTDAENVNLAISVMSNEFGIQSITSGDVLPPSGPDLLAIVSTILELKNVYETLHSTSVTSGVTAESPIKKPKTKPELLTPVSKDVLMLSPESNKAILQSAEKDNSRALSPENKKSRPLSPDNKKSKKQSPDNKKAKPQSPDNKKAKPLSPENHGSKPRSPENKNLKQPISENKRSKLHSPADSKDEEKKKVRLVSPKTERKLTLEPEDKLVSPPNSVFKKTLPSGNKKTKLQNDDVIKSSTPKLADGVVKKKSSKHIDEDDIAFHAPEPSASSFHPPYQETDPSDFKKRVTSQRKLRKKTESKFIAEVENIDKVTTSTGTAPSKGSQKCHTCAQSVLVLKRIAVEGYAFHRKCFICEECNVVLKTSTYHLITSNDPNLPGHFYCKKHFNEVIARSRELIGSIGTGLVQITRNKDTRKKQPRSASVCMKVNEYKREYSPTIPAVLEENDTAKDLHNRPRSQTTPAKGTTSTVGHASVRKPSTSPPRKATSPTSRTKVTITEAQSPERVQTRSPSNRGEVVSSNVVRKKYESTHPVEELPTEGLPDNISRVNPPPRPKPPTLDLLPPTDAPQRKKSSKSSKAPRPPDKKLATVGTLQNLENISVKKSSDSVPDNLGNPFATEAPALVSKKAMSITPASNEKLKETEPKDKPISQGVAPSKARAPADKGVKEFAYQKKRPNLNPIIAEEFARFHSHSTSDLDSYIPDHSKMMRKKYEKDKDEPMLSVQDRIAQYSTSDKQSPAQQNDKKHVETDSDKKKLEVKPDLQKTVSRDGDRIATARPNNTQFKKTKPAKRRLLKPANKQTQKRLVQAQSIQRDRSLLEQKLAEFENEAADVEQQLRNDGKDDALLSQFLELVNMKNELTRRENELHLCEKYLQLMDEQDQIERDLRYLLETTDEEKSEQQRLEEEQLILKKFDVVNRRDYLLTQLYDSKRREEEENRLINDMLVSKELSSSRHSYKTDTFITIEALLESDEEIHDDDIGESLEAFEHDKPKSKRRHKGRCENTDENILSRFMKGMNIFAS